MKSYRYSAVALSALFISLFIATPSLADKDPIPSQEIKTTPRVDPPNLAPPDSGIFFSANIQFYEAHWQGMDTMLLDAELRRKLNYPKGLKGIIVNEVTLQAALSGMLGGDIIIAVEGNPVSTLKNFQQATRTVKNKNHAAITVLRKSNSKNGERYVMNRMVFMLKSRNELGFAQVESAPMLTPGEPRPHPYRGPCVNCHTIGDGRFTMPDPDLINLPPPRISPKTIRKGKSPHRDRGPCLACHNR